MFDLTLHGAGRNARSRQAPDRAAVPGADADDPRRRGAGLPARAGRFGPARAEARAIPFGKQALVDTTAMLLRRAGRLDGLGGRYARADARPRRRTARRAARHCRAKSSTTGSIPATRTSRRLYRAGSRPCRTASRQTAWRQRGGCTTGSQGGSVNIDDVKAVATRIRAEIGKAVTGQADTVDLMLTALFAGGHILLEGPPGTAKTMIARCFAQALGVVYGRIQFTPDLMPGDIVGSNIYNFQTGQFTLTRGPIFCDLLLADEINRTPPKTQAALLEAMQEHAVTFDGTTHSLGQQLHGGGDAEPDRAPGRLSAARGAARPLPVQAPGQLPRRARRSARSSPVMAAARPRMNSQATTSSRRSTAPGCRRRWRRSARSRWSTTWSATSPHSYAARGKARELEVGASPRAGVMLAEGRARQGGARRARLCHPRRRQGACRAGAAPSRDPVGGGADRRAPGRADRRRPGRPDRGAEMIYPSGRAVWAAAAGAVPAFLIALALPSLWYLGLLWICVLIAFIAVDASAGPGADVAHGQPQGGAAGRRRRRFGVQVVARFAGQAPRGDPGAGRARRAASRRSRQSAARLAPRSRAADRST